MAIGVRARAVLPALPVVGALAVYVSCAVLAPDTTVAAMDLRTLTALVWLVGLGSALLLAVAAARCHDRARLTWGSLAAATVLWTLTLAGALDGWPARVVWVGLRGAAFAVAVAGLLAASRLLVSPALRRTAGEWGLLLLDGWLVGVSTFLVGWVGLGLTGSRPSSVAFAPPALFWVPFDLILAGVIAGLAARTDAAERVTAGLLVVASLLAVTGDTTVAFTHHPQLGVGQWLIALGALGCATLGGSLDAWAAAVDRAPAPRLARPQLTRLSQVAVIPGLLAAAAPGRDAATFVAAVSLVGVLAVQMVLLRRQHADLWHALQQHAERLDQVFRESRDAIVQVDGRGRVEFANDAVADVFGHQPQSLLGRSGARLVHPEDRARLLAEITTLADGELAGVRVGGRFRHGDGTWRHLEATVSRRAGGAEGYTLSVRDVSDRARLEAELRRLAATDGLTGLVNRHAFLGLVDERLQRGSASVMFIDLDGFKPVNDACGHAAGDRVLCRVAEALREELLPGDVAARLGGDEFAVLPVVRTVDGARVLAARVIERLGGIRAQNGHRIGASIGVATGRHITAEALLGRADQAMYWAKASGGDCYRLYGPGDVPAVPEAPATGTPDVPVAGACGMPGGAASGVPAGAAPDLPLTLPATPSTRPQGWRRAATG